MVNKIIGVIPARLESTRLPRKVLADIAGKSLLRRVWESASQAKFLDRVIIATDSDEVRLHAESFGALTQMTATSHVSGTDRMAEVASKLIQQGEQIDAFANIQGDMPFIIPEVIDQAIAGLMESSRGAKVSTLAVPIFEAAELKNPSTVKIVLDQNSQAIYFSRSVIPYLSDEELSLRNATAKPLGLKHIGLYVYRTEALLDMTKLAPSELEKTEKLEQLRAVGAGYKFYVKVIDSQDFGLSVHVDTDKDLEHAIRYAKKHCR